MVQDQIETHRKGFNCAMENASRGGILHDEAVENVIDVEGNLRKLADWVKDFINRIISLPLL